MFRSSIAILISLLLLAGCAGPGTTSTGPQPGNSPTPPPYPIAATATKEIPATESFPVVRIKNAETGAYLYENERQAQPGDGSDKASYWIIEDYQGGKRIQNQASGNYLSIEHLKEYVEVIPIQAAWMSPRWTFDAD